MAVSWNFARRPFHDDRPAYALAAALGLAGLVLLVANIRLYSDYRREVSDTRAEIAALEQRQARADRAAQTARTALSSYRLSAMAEESQGILRIVAERRFSWTGLLARLERALPPEVGLSSLQPRFDSSGEASVDLSLFAKNRESVVRTLTALSRDPALGHVVLKSESAGEPGGQDPFRFEIDSRYTPEERP
jgi:Tfp pilus assembly protein PilN